MNVGVYHDDELLALFGDDADAESYIEGLFVGGHNEDDYKIKYETWECYRKDD